MAYLVKWILQVEKQFFSLYWTAVFSVKYTWRLVDKLKEKHFFDQRKNKTSATLHPAVVSSTVLDNEFLYSVRNPGLSPFTIQWIGAICVFFPVFLSGLDITIDSTE